MDEAPSIVTVPRNESSRLELLSVRPPSWEYLLFGYALQAGLERTEPKWRDYHLGYTMEIGPAIHNKDLAHAFDDRISRVGAITSNIVKVISLQAQENAFGPPGTPGDPELIEHMGSRLIMMYEQLLDWAHEIRSLRFEAGAERLPELAVAFVAQPIAETRKFVEDYIAQVEAGIAAYVSGAASPMNITMRLSFELPDAVRKAYEKEIKRVSRGF